MTQPDHSDPQLERFVVVMSNSESYILHFFDRGRQSGPLEDMTINRPFMSSTELGSIIVEWQRTGRLIV